MSDTFNEENNTPMVNVAVNTENDALNLMVQFLNLAQRRGCFKLDESAKIYECIKAFQKPSPQSSTHLASIKEA
jgi:hypothetical protein